MPVEIFILIPVVILIVALFFQTVLPFLQYLKSVTAVLDTAKSIEAGVIIFDAKGNFEFANDLARAVIPMLRDVTKKPRMKDFIYYIHDHSQEMDETVKATLVDNDIESEDFSFREFISFDPDKVFLIKMSKVKGNRILFVMNDVSKSKFREEKFLRMHAQNHQLTQAIEASTCGILVSDPNQCNRPIVFGNDALCEFFGLSRSDIMSGSWSIILDAVADQYVRKEMLLAMLSGEAIALEVCVERDGVVRWLALKSNSVEDDMGHLDLYICVFTDIMLLKWRENEILQNQQKREAAFR